MTVHFSSFWTHQHNYSVMEVLSINPSMCRQVAGFDAISPRHRCGSDQTVRRRQHLDDEPGTSRGVLDLLHQLFHVGSRVDADAEVERPDFDAVDTVGRRHDGVDDVDQHRTVARVLGVARVGVDLEVRAAPVQAMAEVDVQVSSTSREVVREADLDDRLLEDDFLAGCRHSPLLSASCIDGLMDVRAVEVIELRTVHIITNTMNNVKYGDPTPPAF